MVNKALKHRVVEFDMGKQVSEFFRRAFWIAALAILLVQTSLASELLDENDVRIHEPATNLMPLTADIFGDTMDMSTGGAAFYTVDVSVPGNSNLPVQYGRRYDTDNAWTIDAPRLDNVTYCDQLQPSVSLPPGGDENAVTNDWYKEGALKLHVPNHSVKSMKSQPVTTDFWKRTCLTSPTYLNTLVTAPNGDKYYFDVESGDYSALDSYGYPWLQELGEGQLHASKIEDVNGNWVKYVYIKDSGNKVIGVSRIHSSGGREINITYNNDGKVDTVITNGRTWTYSYYSSGEKGLKRVTLPDGNYWEYTNNMEVLAKEDAFNNQSDVGTIFPIITVKHPYGAKMNYKVQGIRNGILRSSCVSSPNSNSYSYMSHAVIEKKLELGSETQTWDHYYEQDAGSCTGGIAPTKYRVITSPDGTQKKVHINREHLNKRKGRVESEVTLDSANQSMRTVETDFVVVSSQGFESDVYVQKRTITQDGDTYTTEYDYDLDSSSSTYSYGNPIQTSVYSNVSATPRVTDMTYEHDTNKWIIGLPKTVTTNGRDIATYVYDNMGQKISETRNGAAYATYAYYTTGFFKGRLYWAKDALSRQTTAFSWKRGTPQRVRRPDLHSTYQYVDDNGWRTSSKDASGNITSYSHDNMGRLTTITPPTGWTPTTISYAFGTGITQTTSKGFVDSIVTYDSLFRPTLVETKDNKPGFGSTSYVKTSYNATGQPTFTSFPSASSTPTDGITTAYDGLGRVTSTTENVAPFATTLHHYFNANRHRVRDPSGEETMYYRSGYSGPGAGPITATIQPTGITTYSYRNVWDEITSARQVGTINGISRDVTHNYYYDAQHRLCRYSEPESGDTLYAYDAAGQLKDTSAGEALGTGCGTMTPVKRSTMYYDILGQNYYTDVWTNATQDIIKTFDVEGNITSLVRGLGSGGAGVDRVDWVYSYDNMNNLTSEVLSLEGGTKTYPMYYGYDADGYMVSRELPSGRTLTLINDGLGRMNKITQSVAATGEGTGQEGPDPKQVYARDVSYHPSGAISGMEYGNGQLFTQTLNARLQPEHLLSQKGSTKALDLTYGYDVRGKVMGITNGAITGDNRTYSYDALGRLTSATGPWGNSAYKYDALGNILEKTVGARTIGMDYNVTTNRLDFHVDKDGSGNDIPGTSVSLGYDTQGNVTQLGGQYFTYSLNNQPTALYGSTGGSYLYDGNKKRVRAVVDGKTIYNVYDASGTLVHVDEATDGKFTDYIGKIARVTNGGWATWLHMDHLGSANTGTDMWGQVTWREKYTPYGTTLINPASNNDQAGFTGHIKDSTTGLTYMQARYYDPLIGRFLSTDPVGFTPDKPQMFNRYAYTWNDPINNTDPDGECGPLCTGLVGAAIGGIVGGGIETYKQAKAGKGFDLKRIGSRAGGGAIVGGLIGLTGGAASSAAVLIGGEAGLSSAAIAATIGLPSLAVGATSTAINSAVNDIGDHKSASEVSANSVKGYVTGGLGAGTGGAASPVIGSALTKVTRFGGPGELDSLGAVVGETFANILAAGVTEGGNALPLPNDDDHRVLNDRCQTSQTGC